jgi:hypothetical protein
MMTMLGHVTAHEFPLGLALFLGGLGVGIGIAAYWRYFRTR